MKPMLTVREASEILHVHGNTLRRWSDQRIIKSYRIGSRGDRRFDEQDINLLLSLLSTNGGNPKNPK